MVDRKSRIQLALALRRLAAGRITNDEFDDEAFAMFCDRTDDPALAELSTYGWLHYSDLWKYRLRGQHALSREARKGIARAVLFLKTDDEYVHGDNAVRGDCSGKSSIRSCLALLGIPLAVGLFTHLAWGVFAFGFSFVLLLAYLGNLLIVPVLARLRRRRSGPMKVALDGTFWPFMDDRAGMQEFRFWPFANQASYQSALANPPFFCGRVSA